MKNPRTYGTAPYIIAVIHGGPGAPGEMAPVAERLSATIGVLEPFQTATSLEGQIEELRAILEKNGNPPLILIGFSWGAWLTYIFAAKYSLYIKKIILISCGPFEEKDAASIIETRLNRLNTEEKKEISSLQETLNGHTLANKNTIFARFGELMFKADSYDPLPYKNNVKQINYQLYQRVWREATELRRSGKLLRFGKNIHCPVVAIHGKYDSHPAYAVRDTLSTVCKNFRFILLKKCGHYPWMETFAQEKFYDILIKEVRDDS
jgi:pimeloyl-ACP methyl ester carboxylesterase